MHCVVWKDAVRLFEREAIDSSIADRLLFAASRLEQQSTVASSYTPRPEQSRVLDDFGAFLLDVATRPAGGGAAFGRIILPPRTGKTVIAGHIIARAGLTTTFVVPTRTLVLQTARALEAQLPGVPVGVYYGERKQTAWHGVNVATYAILQRDLRRGVMPPPIATSALVFADEAHHAMTEDRIDLLRRGFPDGRSRISAVRHAPDAPFDSKADHDCAQPTSRASQYDRDPLSSTTRRQGARRPPATATERDTPAVGRMLTRTTG